MDQAYIRRNPCVIESSPFFDAKQCQANAGWVAADMNLPDSPLTFYIAMEIHWYLPAQYKIVCSLASMTSEEKQPIKVMIC